MARTLSVQDEWDLAWAEYDCQAPRPRKSALRAASPGGAMTAQARRRVVMVAVPALVLGLGLVAPGVLAAWVTPGTPGNQAASLSPYEAELPPLAEALGRLAAESETAACFARRLQPGLPPCTAKEAD